MFVTPSNRKLDVNVVQSNYHIELTPSDVGMYDRVVIQDILKEIAQTQQVDLNAKQKFKGGMRLPRLTPSCHYQRSRRPHARRAGSVASHDGKVHDQHALDHVREQHKQDHCTYPQSLPACPCGRTDRFRGEMGNRHH